MATLHGIDVSHWQRGLDLAKTDAQFVIAKATDGTGMVDPECDTFITQAKHRGIPYGVYHFAQAGGAAEADHFVDSVRGYIGHALLALDWEAAAVERGVGAAKAFLDRVHARTGVRPVIYTSSAVLSAYDWSPVARADYGLWLARWGQSPGDISPWPNLTLWQYTDQHHTAGWDVDGDRFYGTRDTWAAIAAGNTTPTPDPDDPGDDDMALSHVVRSRETNQPLSNTDDWQTLKVREDNDAPSKQLVLGPAKIISGLAYIHATGLGVDGRIDARVYVVDDPDDPGKNTTRVGRAGTHVNLWAPKGEVTGVLPFHWNLSGSGKTGVKRRLQLEVRAASDTAVIHSIRTEMWTQDR